MTQLENDDTHTHTHTTGVKNKKNRRKNRWIQCGSSKSMCGKMLFKPTNLLSLLGWRYSLLFACPYRNQCKQNVWIMRLVSWDEFGESRCFMQNVWVRNVWTCMCFSNGVQYVISTSSHIDPYLWCNYVCKSCMWNNLLYMCNFRYDGISWYMFETWLTFALMWNVVRVIILIWHGWVPKQNKKKQSHKKQNWEKDQLNMNVKWLSRLSSFLIWKLNLEKNFKMVTGFNLSCGVSRCIYLKNRLASIMA